MTHDARDDEAFRTAVGMARAVDRRDLDGLRVLWDGADDHDRVAHWLAALAATTAIAAAKAAGMSTDAWLASQITVYEGYPDPEDP